jgi:hypothetical protein
MINLYANEIGFHGPFTSSAFGPICKTMPTVCSSLKTKVSSLLKYEEKHVYVPEGAQFDPCKKKEL